MVPERWYWRRVSRPGWNGACWHSLSDSCSDGGLEAERSRVANESACIHIEVLSAYGEGVTIGCDGSRWRAVREGESIRAS